MANMDTVEAGPSRPVYERLSLLLNNAMEAFSAVLLVLLMAVLSVGVAARYAFNSPLIWSDEVASILFLWVAMLGSVIALRQSEHMRLTLIVTLLPTRIRGIVEVIAMLLIALLFVALFEPAYKYAMLQWDIATPALEIRNFYRVVIIPVSVILMVLISLIQIFRAHRLPDIAIGAGVVLVIALIGFLARDLITPNNVGSLLLLGATLLLCLAAGVPIAFCFGIATAVYIEMATMAPLGVMVSRLDEGMSNFLLVSVPVFIVLGFVMDSSGMGKALINFLLSVLGHVRGGLSYVLLGSMYLVSGISGSKIADMATVAPALFPEMKRRGYDPKEMVAQLATGAVMAETVPPSIVMIAVGSATGVSIAGLFNGGLAVALVLAIVLAVVSRYRVRDENHRSMSRPKLGTVVKTLVIALPVLILPFLIRGAVVEGIATATEVSTFAVFYAVVASMLIYGLDYRGIYPMLTGTVSLTGAVLLVIGTSHAMGWAITQSGFAQALREMMTNLPGGAFGFMAVSILIFIVLGCLMEGLPALLLMGPMLFPIASQFGIDGVLFALVGIVAMNIGMFAPPIGIGYYLACSIGRVEPDAVMRTIWPYLSALLVGLLVIAGYAVLMVN